MRPAEKLATQAPRVVLPLLKLVVFTLLVPCTVTLWLPASIYRDIYRWNAIEFDVAALGGALLIAIGAAGYFWCALDFAFRGRGTPAPIDPPKILVARGLYSLVRNPMYVSVLAVLLGESFLFRSWALVRYAVAVGALFHLVVILYEEPVLQRKFGASYEEYRRNVSRWIPRLRRERSNR